MARRSTSKVDETPAPDSDNAAPGAKTRSRATDVNLRGQALAPDLEVIRRFIVDMIARGAIAELIASVLALLQRMRISSTAGV